MVSSARSRLSFITPRRVALLALVASSACGGSGSDGSLDVVGDHVDARAADHVVTDAVAPSDHATMDASDDSTVLPSDSGSSDVPTTADVAHPTDAAHPTDSAVPDAGSCRPYVDLHAAERAACTFTTGANASATLGDFTAARAAIQHVIIVVHENRSMDHYFGHTGHGIEGLPAGFTNPNASGTAVAPFHYSSGCACDISHSTAASQGEWDHGAMDGFVRTDGLGAMGYYTDADHPFYTWLLTTFATSDRYFCAALSDTGHNRHYLWHASATVGPTVLTELSTAGVNWMDYYESGSPLYGEATTTSYPGHTRLDTGLSVFYAALRDPTGAALPALSIVDQEPTEHPSADFHGGEAAMRTLVSNVLASPSWPHIAMFFTYDEGGGFLDHVPPPAACLASTAATEAGFDHLGIRVPSAVISPYAIGGYVSHVTHSHSSITRFLEMFFNVTAITPRDANADAMLDMFDFGCPHFMTPPAAATIPAAGHSAACGACASGP